jgi:hypothetical protein
MIVTPWSPELGSASPLSRGARDPDRSQPVEPVVVQPPLDLFAVRVEIIAGDRRRVVNAPPVYVAPPAARVIDVEPELPRQPRPLQLTAGDAGPRESSLDAAPFDRPTETAASSIERVGAERRAFAAYGAQLEAGRHAQAEALGQHVRIRA